MSKFHINPKTGEPGSCSAKSGNCPFGSDDKHFTSADAARVAYEASQDSQTFSKMSLKEMNSIARNESDPAVIDTLINEGSLQTHRNMLNNENLTTQNMRDIMAKLHNSELRARYIIKNDELLSDATVTDYTTAVAQLIMSDKFTATLITNYNKTPLEKLVHSPMVTDAHYESLMNTSTLSDKQKSRLRPMLVAKNQISSSKLREYYENNNWSTYPLSPATAAVNGKLRDEDLLAAPAVFLSPLMTDRMNQHHSDERMKVFEKIAMEKNSVDAKHWLASNERTSQKTLHELAKGDLLYPKVYMNPNASPETKALIEKERGKEPFIKIEKLKATIGEKELKSIMKTVERKQLGRAYSETSLQFDVAKLKEYDLNKADVHYLAGANGYNAGISYNEETGLWSGRLDTSD